MLLILKNKEQKYIDLYIHKLEENNNIKQVKLEKKKQEERTVNKEEIEKIRKELEWEYKYKISSIIPTKTSVTKLKEEKNKKLNNEVNEIELDELLKTKKESNMQIPKFIKEDIEQISSARKGSLVHLCLQKLDENKTYTKDDLENLICDLVNRKIILKQEVEIIPIIALENYLKSDLWKDLKNSREVHKEEAFYLELTADRISKDYPKDEKILLQGIIDLYYINENDELILVDYKTDYVERGEEQKLIDKYKMQLDLYKEALEKSLNRKVDKVMIYSTWIGQIDIKL